MVSHKNLYWSLVLMIICSVFSYPSWSRAQTDVTLSVSDGAGVRGSFCCNPNYPDGNRVEVSLDNPADKVGIVQVNICSPDLGDELVFSGYEIAPRAQAVNNSISYNATTQCIQVRFFWTQPYGSVYIPEGSGTIATLEFNVAQDAPDGNCPAGGGLTMSGVVVRDELNVGLTVSTDPGTFCYYNCGSDLHCDDGIFCNGQEVCFSNFWCIDDFGGDPCSPLLCNETTDTCSCTNNGQCEDGLYCTTDTCVSGNCKQTSTCASDGDPCTKDCDETGDTCLNPRECTADGPWDACCTSSVLCGGEPVCNEEVTLTVGNGSGTRSSTGNNVVVSLANPSDQVRAVQVEICDVDDYLSIQPNCVPSSRVPTGAYTCQCNEQPSGCATCTLSADLPSSPNILAGNGTLFTVKYNVSGDAPFGQCRDLQVNTEASFNVLTKVCSPGSSNPGAYCVFETDCPGGTCSVVPVVAMPVDGEFCVPCTTDAGCFDNNVCTTDRCVSSLCTYTNLTSTCNDGDACTSDDRCRKPYIGTKNQCVGIDSDPDDGSYCNGVESCDGLAPNPCGSCDEGNDLCVGSDVTLTVANAYGREGVIAITLENSFDEVGEVHLDLCDADQRNWLHISADSCSNAARTGAFDCIATDLGGGCVGVDIVSSFPLDFIPIGTGAIAYLNYTVDPVTIPMDNYADLDPQAPDVRDSDAFSLSVTPRPGRLYAVEYCEGNFNPEADDDVDAEDVGLFLADFGRNLYQNPCKASNPCNGDFDCDTDVDATDVKVFMEDFGRSLYQNPCPPFSEQYVCTY